MCTRGAFTHRLTGDGSMTGWEHLEHGADIGVRGFGASAESFEQAALALSADQDTRPVLPLDFLKH